MQSRQPALLLSIRFLLVVLVAASVSITTPVQGQVLNEDLKILPADGVTGDILGWRIDISNGFVIIGANGVDDTAANAGAAYVFDLSIDSPLGTQVHKLFANDGAAGDNFGISVAIETSSIVIAHNLIGVGANADDDKGDGSGAAYLFNPTTGAQIIKYVPVDGAMFDAFGSSIAIDEGLVVIGAHGDDDNGGESGSAYLYDSSIDSPTGAMIFKLLPLDGAADDQFGFSVAIDNGIVAVGAYRNDDNGSNSGSAYLFDASTGLQLHKLLPLDGAADDWFGYSVAIHNGIVVVGAYGDDDNSSLSGSAYLFDASTGLQLYKLLPSDGGVNQSFGLSVAIENGLVAVGTPVDNDNGGSSGSAYLFDSATGNQLKKLLPSDGAAAEFFGISIAMDNEIIATGAWQDNDNGALSGSAYVFKANCLADLNGDGFVNVTDLLLLLAAWGPNPGHVADINGDGNVNVTDLLALLAAWGACP